MTHSLLAGRLRTPGADPSPQGEFLASVQDLIGQATAPARPSTGLAGSLGSIRGEQFSRQRNRARATSTVLSNPGFFQALAGLGADTQTDRLISGLTAGGRTQVSGGGGGGGFKFPSVSGVQAPQPQVTKKPPAEKATAGAKGATSITGSLLTPLEDDARIKRPTLLGG